MAAGCRAREVGLLIAGSVDLCVCVCERARRCVLVRCVPCVGGVCLVWSVCLVWGVCAWCGECEVCLFFPSKHKLSKYTAPAKATWYLTHSVVEVYSTVLEGLEGWLHCCGVS